MGKNRNEDRADHMKIDYTYTIANVDEQAKSMEIIYNSPEFGVLHVGARLPWKGETLDDIVLMYNPTAYWLEQAKETEPVEDGASGEQSIETNDEDNSDDVNTRLEKELILQTIRDLGLLP